MDPFNWTCPYCNHAQTVIGDKFQVEKIHFDNDSDTEFGLFCMEATVVICANNECQRVSLTAILFPVTKKVNTGYGGFHRTYGDTPLKGWNLFPESMAKPQPNCIPSVIQQDYIEACRIRNLSPKAAATLARRCLQGMIRDFSGISKRSLFDEINELRRQVDAHEADRNISPDTVDAIDAVRTIGNIGAHMEKDINLIIDVDENEVEVLIELIEALFKEWYVAREKRTERLAKITQIAQEKDNKKKQNSGAAPADKEQDD